MRLLLAPLLLLSGLALSACGEEPLTAETVTEQMLARFNDNFDGVEDFTATTDELTAYYRRGTADSLTAFVIRVAARDSVAALTVPPQLITYLVPEVPRFTQGLRRGAGLDGPEVHDGHRVYVLRADHPQALTPVPDAGAPLFSDVRLYVDAETFAIRELRFEVPSPDSNATQPIVERILYDDYRTVEGVSLPFRVSTITSGLKEAIPEEYRIVMGGNLALRRAQAERLPSGERDAALREIAAQERLLNEGIQESTLALRNVQVNEGAPAALADSTEVPAL